ncbi:uncharacterized protein PV07_01923 [Cladophialophora immunda]|uniref:Uncharacterized protein n=1 Tax=Cladophialophora immunda TaxID=569365 RepID=A0A0D2A4G7_9EURO|nr:uncharacterized protein PV07_01923 [Cladophialophora immunda]KIW35216.1 hypothetical protein PV07_01923 [Cladophialophora immunda]
MADPITLAVAGAGVAVALAQLGQAAYQGHKEDKQNRKMLQMVQQNNVYGSPQMGIPVSQPARPSQNTHTLAISHQTMGRQSTFTSPDGWFVSVGHGPEARSSGTFITHTTSYGNAFPTSHVNPNIHGFFQPPAFLPQMSPSMMLPVEHTHPYTTGRVVELPQRMLSYPIDQAPQYPTGKTTVGSKRYHF